MVRTVRSSATLLATALLVPAVLAALAAPASARLTENVTLNLVGQFADTVDTEMVQLNLMGGFAVQVVQPSPSQAPAHLMGTYTTDMFFDITWPTPEGVSEVKGGFHVDSFFDVFAAGDATHFVIIADALNAAADDVPLGGSPFVLHHFALEIQGVEAWGPNGVGQLGDSFFDVFTEVTISAGPNPAPVADYHAESDMLARVQETGAGPTASADSFFDVFFDVLHPPNPNNPAMASSFFDIFTEVTRSTPTSDLYDVRMRVETANQVGIGASAKPGEFDVFAGEHTSMMAMLMTPLLTESIKIEHEGFDSAVGVNPGPIQLQGRSFFDVFFEVERAGGTRMVFEGSLSQDSKAAGNLTLGSNGVALGVSGRDVLNPLILNPLIT